MAHELNDEQHIELVETDRVHDEEVGSQDALGLSGDELLPGRSTARSGSEPVLAKDAPDRDRVTVMPSTPPAPLFSLTRSHALDRFRGS
jgi:hypothetical protein